MDIRKVINNYIECNNFMLKIINNKLYIYYYDEIIDFTSKMVKLLGDNKKYLISGNNLVIEQMFKEELIINGDIKLIEMEKVNEK